MKKILALSLSDKHIKIQLILAWGCLLAGTSIYLLFRSRNHLVFFILDSVGLKIAIDTIRSMTGGIDLPEFVRFCLPDGLWTSSYILFSDYFNKNEKLTMRLLLASIIPLLGIASELLQSINMIPGTFDPLDIACYALPLLLWTALILIRNKAMHGHNQSFW